MTAPTLGEILAHNYDLSIHCPTCRKLTVPNLDSIVRNRPLDTPVDKLKFRCVRCGEVGKVIVTGQGNLTTGHPRIWPLDP